MDNQSLRRARVGKCYRRIAKKFAKDVPEDKFEEALASGDLRKIETYVTVEGPLREALKRFSKRVSSNRVSVPCDLYWTMMFSEAPKEELKGFRKELREHHYSRMKKVAFAMEILEAVHDEWVRLHCRDFFVASKLRQRNRFVEFELIGFDEVVRYLPFLEIIFEMVGWEVDLTVLPLAYHREQEAFNDKFGLKGSEDLVRYTMEADYPSLSPEIAQIYRSDRRVVEKVLFS